MGRFRDLMRAHKKAWFGLWILVLVGLVAGLQWWVSGGSLLRTQVLGASVKATPAPTITSGPSGATSSTSPTFTYSDTEKGVTFACGLNPAALSACPSGGISYTGLAQGSYTFTVVAHGISVSPAATRSWTVDVTAPPAPTISGPDNPTFDTAAHFAFTGEAGARFECQLDGASPAACVSPVDYKKVSIGDHAFSVVATDAAGNRSAQATWLWTVLINKAFGISGNAAGSLFPGMTATPLNLTFTNPYNFPISVLSVTVTIHSPSTGCIVSDNFDPPNPNDPLNPHTFTLAKPVVVPANASATPTGTQRPAGWPTITMKNSGDNQDMCKNTTFTLSYSGTAQKS